MKTFFNIPRSFLWGIFIFILTLIPGPMLPEVPDFMSLFQPDKIIHLFLFSVFVILLIRDFRRRNTGYPVFWPMAIAMATGAVTEILQELFIPGRLGSVYDAIANAGGCFLGWGISYFFFNRK